MDLADLDYNANFDNEGGDLRNKIAQSAAKLIYEENFSNYVKAKRKAIKQLGLSGHVSLPSNAEIDAAIKHYHQLFSDESDALHLHDLRRAALITMQLLAKFNPYLSGYVAGGIAGPNASTDIYLFAESEKEVEFFLLNQNIPYQLAEKSYSLSSKANKNKTGKGKYNSVKKTVPMILLETQYGTQKITIFNADDIRNKPKTSGEDPSMLRVSIDQLSAMLD